MAAAVPDSAGIQTRYHPFVQIVQNHYRMGDILANAITHGVGAALAIAGATYLVATSIRGPAKVVVGCSIFGVTLVLVYLCSTLYHALVLTRARHVLHILDHSAIYLLIAGTYTPFTLVCLRGAWEWWIFGAQWGLAFCGVIFKSFAVDRFHVLSALVYLCQGWMAILVIRSLFYALTWGGFAWLIAGGLAYTLGFVFYAFDRLPYFHAAWHIFVMVGSIAHFAAILFYVVPARL